MHRHPAVFPDPDKFDPDRWLDADEARRLDKYFTAFSKGNRMCIGRNLAMCELYVTVGQLFRRFGDLQSYETRPEDLVYEDYFAPFHPENARPLKIGGSDCRG